MTESGMTVHTPRYYSVLGAAEQVARGLSHSHVGVEHLFLAILRDPQAIPTQVLGTMVDLRAVESALVTLMNSDSYTTGTANIVPPRTSG